MELGRVRIWAVLSQWDGAYEKDEAARDEGKCGPG